METIARTFIIRSGENQFTQQKVFGNARIGRVDIAMNTISAFTGHFQENPFHYQKFGLGELRVVRGGRALVSLDTINDCRAKVTTRKAMRKFLRYRIINFRTTKYSYSISLPFKILEKNIYYPELSGESIRLEMFLDLPSRNVTEIIVLRGRISNVKNDQFGTVAKNV